MGLHSWGRPTDHARIQTWDAFACIRAVPAWHDIAPRAVTFEDASRGLAQRVHEIADATSRVAD